MKRFVLATVVFAVMAMVAFGQNASDFRTTVANGQVTITGYTGSVNDVRIPKRINGLPVIAIGDAAFYGTRIMSVKIPNSVTSIGVSAFSGTRLTSVTIPNSVTFIGNSAFYGIPLTSVNIPNSISSIEDAVFFNTRLTSVTIPSSVTSIGAGAFKGNQLRSVKIPDSVTSIGNNAFEGNQLTSVKIPDSVTSIGYVAFDTGVAILQNGQSISGTQNGLFYILLKKTITICKYTGDAEDVRIPDNINGFPVTSIGAGAFMNTRLRSVTIPDSVISIGDNAFTGSQLTSVTLPASVTSIGRSVFDSRVRIIRE